MPLPILVQRRYRQSAIRAKCLPRLPAGFILSNQLFRLYSTPPPLPHQSRHIAHDPSPSQNTDCRKECVALTDTISRFDGWRFWLLAISGTLIGPALSIAVNLCIRLAEPSQKFDVVEGWKVESVVTATSLIATALYLGTVRFSARSRAL
jgi:hypothetical protein